MGIWTKEPHMVPVTLQLTFDPDEGLFHIEILAGEDIMFIARYDDKIEAMKYGYALESLTELPLWLTPGFEQAAG